MENTDEETSHNNDEMKEKVRVVSLVDPTLSKNMDNSVWSLCDINNDDTHVDLRDITPSIGSGFTEEQVMELTDHQMVDPMTHRLLDDGDSIFSVSDINPTLARQKASPLHDFHSDLDMFNREMQSMDGIRNTNHRDTDLNQPELNSNGCKRGNVGGDSNDNIHKTSDKGTSRTTADTSTEQTSRQTSKRRSPRKQLHGSKNEISASSSEYVKKLRGRRHHITEETETLNKTRQETAALKQAKNTENTDDDEDGRKGPTWRSTRSSKQVAQVSEKNANNKDSDRKEPAAKDMAELLSSTVAAEDDGKKQNEKSVPNQDPQVKQNLPEKQTEVPGTEQNVDIQRNNITQTKDVNLKFFANEEAENVKGKNSVGATQKILTTREKRITRSTTGSLKPKQAFDEIQEKKELENAKRIKKKVDEPNKSKVLDLQTVDAGVETSKGQPPMATNEVKIDQESTSNVKDLDPKQPEIEASKKDKPSYKKKGIKGVKSKKEHKKKGMHKSGKSSSQSPTSKIDDIPLSDSDSSDAELDFHADDSDYSPEDDPDRLWCICKQPHGNRFMICCDGCEEWFHGKCVGISMEQGKIMEKKGQEYVCKKCKEKSAKEAIEEDAKLHNQLKDSKHTKDTKESKETKKSSEAVKPKEISGPTRSSSKSPLSRPRLTAKESPLPTPDLKLHLPQPESAKNEEKKRKPKEPGGFKIPKKVRTTPTPAPRFQPPQKCIGEGCPKSAYEGAVYCGRTCMERHVSQAIRVLSSKEVGNKPHSSEGNRVAMIEKSSGRVIAGMAAPLMSHLVEWIIKNPSFQVLLSGTSPTSPNSSTTAFYNKPHGHIESKVKKEMVRKNEEETIRSNVRRTMKEILVARKKESTDIRIPVEEIMKLVAIIEEDMHKAFKDTSHRYKAKYRTLMFNLKDPRNKVLYRRVLTGDIAPDKLIWMSSDELATKELAQWREQETKHMIDMIKKEEEVTNKARLIKKTHKGEVDVDGEDDLSTLETSNAKEESNEAVPAQKAEKGETISLVDTTEEHRAHLFDLNCKICTGKITPPGETVPHSPASVSNVPIQAAAESSVPSPPREVTLVEPASPESSDFATAPTTSTSSSKLKEKSVWKGFVMMQSVAKFGTNAYLVSGSAEDLIQVLPDTLHVHGRIAHEQVWDYVYQCKTSATREMCLIRFAAASDEEKISYVSLYSYFHSRKRCGVIGNCYSGVKDMYLIPLASHQPVPPELMPFKGPGLQEPRPHMLLGLIIRTKVGKRARTSTDRLPSSSPRAVGEPSSKKSNVNGVDLSKSTTPNSKATTPTLRDSPVDEIEDIVFHFHNSQAKLNPEPEQHRSPQPSQPIAPIVNTLLQIQAQDKKLQTFQEQSKQLRNPSKALPRPSSSLLSSLDPGVSAVISRLAGSVTQAKTESQTQLLSKGDDRENMYDPETAYDEETPYDPEDLDLSLEEEKPAKNDDEAASAVTKAPSTTTTTFAQIKTEDLVRAIASTVTQPAVVHPGVKSHHQDFSMQRKTSTEAERTHPGPVSEKRISQEEYRKPGLVEKAPATQSNVNQDPRQHSRHAHASPDGLHGRYPSQREYRESRRESEDPRRDSEYYKYQSKPRSSERRWSDDKERAPHRQDGYNRERDREYERDYDRNRHSRHKWRR